MDVIFWQSALFQSSRLLDHGQLSDPVNCDAGTNITRSCVFNRSAPSSDENRRREIGWHIPDGCRVAPLMFLKSNRTAEENMLLSNSAFDTLIKSKEVPKTSFLAR